MVIIEDAFGLNEHSPYYLYYGWWRREGVDSGKTDFECQVETTQCYSVYGDEGRGRDRCHNDYEVSGLQIWIEMVYSRKLTLICVIGLHVCVEEVNLDLDF